MKRKTMSIMLRLLLVFLVLAAGMFFFVFLPFYGSELAQAAPEYAWAYLPCLLWAWLFALPLFFSAIPAWNIFGTIAVKHAAFTAKNAKRFRLIAVCFCASGVIFPAGMITLAFLGAGSPAITLISPFVFVAFCALGFVSFVMSRLVLESAEIKAENDLTV